MTFKIDLDSVRLPEGDPRCPNCKADHYAPQKAAVAFSSIHNAAVVIAGTRALICDFKEAGIDAGDVWEAERDGAPEYGIEIWEGRIVYTTTPSTPNGPEEFDVDYEGTWRRPTPEEWAAIHVGLNPFAMADSET